LARTVQLAVVAIFVAWAATAGPSLAGNPNASDQRLVEASRHYFDYVTARDVHGYRKIRGGSVLRCERRGDSMRITMPSDLYRHHGLSVITPGGLNIKIYYPMEGGFLAKTVTVESTGARTTLVVRRYKTVDPNGRVIDGRTHAASVWGASGRYVFVVTNYLPSWNVEDDEEYRADQFAFFGYCAIKL
jgi:hypothetical protein